MVLRPISILVCGYGLWTLSREQVAAHRSLFLGFAAFVILVIVQILPLPPAGWSSLPGRDLILTVDALAGSPSLWRPLSMVPVMTLNALFALAVPLAVLIMMVQLDHREHRALIPLLVGLGMTSGAFGLLQSVGAPDSALYFYNITNNGSAVGLMANRNHQAVLLASLFPVLAIFASEKSHTPARSRQRSWFAVVCGAVLVPLLMVTGSRIGLLIGVVGLATVPLLYRKPTFDVREKRSRKPRYLQMAGLAFGVIALVVLTILFARASALDRLLSTEQGGETRILAWNTTIDLIWKYFPLGTGFGSFAPVYQIDEPLTTLSYKYLNHAHNDWLEILLEGGLPALIFLLIGIAAWIKTALSAFSAGNDQQSQSPSLTKLGLAIWLLLAISSAVDYPLRVPSLMCLAMMAAVWCANGHGANRVIPKSDLRADKSVGIRLNNAAGLT